MKSFDKHLELVKEAIPDFQFGQGARSLFVLREQLYVKKRSNLAEAITLFECYYSAIEECLTEDNSLEAKEINRKLFFGIKIKKIMISKN